MTSLVLALYVEGRTDERFLPIVVQRTAERILLQRGRGMLDVLPPFVLVKSIDLEFSRYAERVLAAARQTVHYDALIIHADADHPTREPALQQRIQPGLDLVEQARRAGDPVCDQLLPIIPIRMTEAWMLADTAALRTVIGTTLSAHELGLPGHAHEVEAVLDPKHTLNQAMQAATSRRRRRRLSVGAIYEPLARQLDLDHLSRVPAYQQFVQDLILALTALQLVH